MKRRFLTIVLVFSAVLILLPSSAKSQEVKTRELLNISTGDFWSSIWVLKDRPQSFKVKFGGLQGYNPNMGFTKDQVHNATLKLQIYVSNNRQGDNSVYLTEVTAPYRDRYNPGLFASSIETDYLPTSRLPFRGTNNYIFALISIIINGRELRPQAKYAGVVFRP